MVLMPNEIINIIYRYFITCILSDLKDKLWIKNTDDTYRYIYFENGTKIKFILIKLRRGRFSWRSTCCTCPCHRDTPKTFFFLLRWITTTSLHVILVHHLSADHVDLANFTNNHKQRLLVRRAAKRTFMEDVMSKNELMAGVPAHQNFLAEGCSLCLHPSDLTNQEHNYHHFVFRLFHSFPLFSTSPEANIKHVTQSSLDKKSIM